MNISFSPLGLLGFALNKRYDSEMKFLTDLQKSLSEWYNQLATPVLPILSIAYRRNDCTTVDVEAFRKVSEELFKQQIVHNGGDEIKNLLEQLPERGIVCVRDNAKLRQAIYDMLHSGDYLKKSAFILPPDHFDDAEAFEQYVREIYKAFRKAKGSDLRN